MRKIQFLLVLFITTSALSAKADFTYNNNCIAAYKSILSLKIPEAKLLLQKEKQQNPQNGIVPLLENYIDYFSLLASESKIDYEKCLENKSDRLRFLEDNTQASPFYLYSQAEVYLQWALLKSKFGDYLSSAMDAKKANNLFKDNAKKYPAFILNQKGIAMVNVIFGAIPASLKGISRFLGMSGSVETGVSQLENLKANIQQSKYPFYNDELVFFICNIIIDQQHKYADYPKLLNYLAALDGGSLLKTFLQAHIAYKSGHNDDAINFLKDYSYNSQYIKLPLMNQILGNCKLNRLDADAQVYLLKFISEFKGNSLIKDTYLKVAYFYFLHNDAIKYSYYLKLVNEKGYVNDEKDKQALMEANDSKPDEDLLKARLLFDGAYYEKALLILTAKEINNNTLTRDKIEYYYRLGRIYDKTNKLNDALNNYQKAINLGKKSNYYFAANAALNMGRIYELKSDLVKAKDYYQQTLDMPSHGYQNSIDDEAKAGLKRIGN